MFGSQPTSILLTELGGIADAGLKSLTRGQTKVLNGRSRIGRGSEPMLHAKRSQYSTCFIIFRSCPSPETSQERSSGWSLKDTRALLHNLNKALLRDEKADSFDGRWNFEVWGLHYFFISCYCSLADYQHRRILAAITLSLLAARTSISF